MNTNNPNITNIVNLKPLVDPRYGKVLVVDSPNAVQLHKLDVAYAVIDAGATSPPHYHATTEEAYAIAKGNAVVVIDGVTTPVGPGDIIRIPVFSVHAITAGPDGCEFWVSTSPPYALDDDVETDAVTVEKPPTPGVKIALLIGTHRIGSLSAKIARQVGGMYRELGIAVDLIDPAELPIELFLPASYVERYNPDTPLARRFIAADGIVTVTPEYNGSLSGIVKHLLDIVPYKNCFDGKPVAMVGVAAGDFGAVRTLDHLAGIFAYRNAHIFGKRVFIKNVDEAPMDENGHLIDPEIVTRLRAQTAGFANFVGSLRSVDCRA